MSDNVLRGAAAVVGVAEQHYKRGEAPHSEKRMTLEVILEACADAGVNPREIDGFVSYAGGANDGAIIGGALLIDELRWSNMMWGGGGGSVAAAITNAATAIATGQAECVVVYRAMTQADTGRLGYAKYHYGSHFLAHGIGSPAQICAMRTQRMLEHGGVPRSAMRSLVLASYQHAQNNPTAQGYGRPLDEESYENSRLIAEPFHLFDCSRESDGAVALVLVSAERAKTLRPDPAYLLSGAQGAPGGYSELIDNDLGEQYMSAGFGPANNGKPGVAERLWSGAGLGPDDVDVVQVYENFSGPAVAALIDHGLCPPGEAAGTFMTVDNLTAPNGKLPVNTSGGNLADSFINGLNLAVEAVRQIRGTSTNPVAGAKTSLFIGGPMAPLVSSVLLGHEDTL
ncbi:MULTISPECIES: thiolase C-terminal domain-containing protein [unclassified Rhodococcus (in: high G+C Gram-positive bacteria)]|uniref:thiolase C-terminal domain-containing protein n=1 Tax=unclassified Rhodococcus (in: high G+C Gram-positive bacteria) TaxID=192944 RepID=UPI000928BFA6|nr:transporter [Rhodococcus sp. M8]OLL20844.1 transporter [Rhodococcus sp. M8]QPG44691.1 transporter [Rhodococcus sp. M8]